MNSRSTTQTKSSSYFTPIQAGILQRKSTSNQSEPSLAPPIFHEVLRSPGHPLDAVTRTVMEPHLNHNFSRVRVHTDTSAAASASAVNALAYTIGNNVVFGEGQYAPGTTAGKQLIAHELTHVVQQNSASPEPQTKLAIGATNDPAEQEAIQAESFTGLQPSIAAKPGAVLARAPKKSPPAIGSKFVPPSGATSKFKDVHAEFDGQDFIVYDGTTVIMTQASQSGKPISVRSSDATACGGSTADAYINNPLYVGIQDFGAIPEGEFTVSLSEFSTFGAWEQAQMITGGMFTDPFGQALHGGDWGAGRAPLRPKTILPGKGCGDTSKRSGFYLHGGSLPGSSGCIDIDNRGISTFLSTLGSYKSVIPVKVKYKYAAPTVGTVQRGIGRFTYPTKDGKPIKDPSIWDRIKAIGGGDDAAPPEQKLPPKPEQPKPAKKPKSQTKPKSKQKESGKKTGLLWHSNEEMFAGYDLDEEDSILDDDREKEDVIG
jgi:Domain of unknown function (DUF4157)